jgi:hypothetical protein
MTILKEISAVALIMIACVSLIFLLGGSKTGCTAGIFSSPYTVDCQITPGYNFPGPHYVLVDLSIKEPAATPLGMILIDPNKKENCFGYSEKGGIAQHVITQICDPLPGTWIIVIKTADPKTGRPERTVWQKEVKLPLSSQK